MEQDKTLFTCRVCGYINSYMVWGEDGETPSWLICPCCGSEHGNEDVTTKSILNNRKQWISNGMRWFDKKEKPHTWDVKKQLNSIPLKYL